jgi:protein arginine kinase activator
MLCEKCQTNEAIMHLTHFFNGRGGTLHLCADCARKLGLDAFSPPFGASMEHLIERLRRIGAPDLSEVPSLLPPSRKPAAAATKDETCPSCGTSLALAEEKHVAGCPECHRWLLDKQGRPEGAYFGKIPASLPPAARARLETLRLRDLLREAVRAERYEEAAVLRTVLRAHSAATPGAAG